MQCTGCMEPLVEDNSLKCNTCDSHYCLQCLNFGSAKTGDLSQDQLSSLKCPLCTNVSQRRGGPQRSKRDSFSPFVIKSKPNSASSHITLESISELLDQKLAPTSKVMIESRKTLINEVQQLINSEMSKITNELRAEFTETTDFIMKEVSDLKETIHQKNEIIQNLTMEQTSLKNEMTALRSRCSIIEKQSRDHNIELQAVPEDRNENTITIFKALCDAIKCPVADSDIHACRRVAKMNSTSKRPRNIVVTLSAPRLRDELISAVHRFNKNHKKEKLNTRHIGLPGEDRQIYVSEHLSPETKQLYAATRRFAKEKNYAYFWVKYGQIYLRKTDKDNAIRVKNTSFLESLK